MIYTYRIYIMCIYLRCLYDVYMMFIIGVHAKSIPQLLDLTEFLRPGSGYEGQRRASPHEPGTTTTPKLPLVHSW